MDTNRFILHIELHTMDRSHAHSPYRLVSLEWKAREKNEQKDPPNGDCSHLAKIIIDGLHSITIESLTPPNPELQVFVPQWPWIFAHCIATSDLHPMITNLRLGWLCSVFPAATTVVPALQEFQLELKFAWFTMSRNSFHRWMKIMFPVTSSLVSLHSHSTITEMCGHVS
jgi:hypothetical protein